MSSQINLYHPRFLRQRDLLTLQNLAIAAVVVYAVLAAVAGRTWEDATARRSAAATAEGQLKSMKQQVDAEAKAAAARKPNPQLTAELDATEGLLRRRSEIARLLESGAIGSTGGFADYLRGFARQAPEGLWLTGFTIGSGGSDMEIRGSMLNAGALPEYIRRLGTEKVFQGRSFAALTMNRADPPAVVPVAPGKPAAGLPALPVAPRSIDFVLMPRLVETKEAR